MDGPIPIPTRLFFSIFKPVTFKKLNGAGRRDEKIHKSVLFIFYFCLYFIFFILKFKILFFIILKLIYFIKIKIL